jgi:hypothetical protein
VTNQVGDLVYFGEVYVSKEAIANILSFSLVRDKHVVDYDYKG